MTKLECFANLTKMKILKFLILITTWSIYSYVLSSPAISNPLQEAEIWVTKEVNLPLGENMTIQEVRNLARQRARDMAIEEAVGTFIKSFTVVYNYQLAEDIIISLRRGVIVEEKVEKEGFTVQNDTAKGQTLFYQIILKAKVKSIPVERREGFKVTLNLNRQVFKAGEDVEIRVRPTRDSYIYIFDIFQDDAVTLLVPNRYFNNNFIKANTELVFPGAGLYNRNIRLKAMLPDGLTRAAERVKVIATTERIEFFDKEIKEAIFQEFAGKSDTLIINIFQILAQQDPSTWTEATAIYEIRK